MTHASLRVGLLAASLALWVWLSELATGQLEVCTWWACQWQYIRDALPFEVGHRAFEGHAFPPSGVMALLTVMGLGWLLQAAELLMWWRQARRRLNDPEARVWLALGGSLLGETALVSGVQESPAQDEPDAGDLAPESEARHRHPEMQLCWWWADGQSRAWQAVSVRCLWCSPRLLGLEISPQIPGGQGVEPSSQPHRHLGTHRVWLWPDSASSEDLHQLRLWLLWPPAPHGLPRQPPPLETLRRGPVRNARPR